MTRLESSPEQEGTIVSFHQLNYELVSRKLVDRLNLSFLKKETKKSILHNLNGTFLPGMNAILGPTGSGKSTLLDILADRKHSLGIKGEIFINGRARSSKMKYQIGYVAQNDAVSGMLTVRENLMFSANVRLSADLSLKEKTILVDNVIEQLDLEKCADSKVGDEYQRGISGGEKRRLNIGLELVLSPRVLFLDEPTTGLDSATARNVIKYLHVLSKKNHTIILSIHQPQYSIFKLFDRVLLMTDGYCIYHGSRTNILPYFQSIGFICEKHDNPADFILDVCQGEINSTSDSDLTDFNRQKNCHEWAIELNEQYLKSEFVRTNEVLTTKNESISFESTLIEQSRFTEFYYLCERTLRTTFRNPALLVMQVAFPIFLALLIGLIYQKLGNSLEIGSRNRLGAIYFIIANQVFGNLSALEIFLKERILFVHETNAGYYHVKTYFLSKLVCDLLPMRTIPSILFSITVYFFVGFQATVSKFLLFFIGIFLTVLCASSLCFFVSASVQLFSVGNLLAAAFCTITSIFTSLVVDLTSITPFLQWIRWISIFQYAFNYFAINEFTGLQLTHVDQNRTILISGEEILKQQKIDHDNSWDFFKNALALLGMIFVFLFLAFIQLHRLKNKK